MLTRTFGRLFIRKAVYTSGEVGLPGLKGEEASGGVEGVMQIRQSPDERQPSMKCIPLITLRVEPGAKA